VEKLGTVAISVSELIRACEQTAVIVQGVVSETELLTLLPICRNRLERIIFTNGCFDLLHPGHVQYLEQARALGDRLIVGVNDDASVRRLKGSTRPINSLQQRMAVLAGLRAVDWVVSFSEDTPERLIQALSPHVLVKGGDYQHTATLPGAAYVLAQGGEVRILDLYKGCSTTQMVTRIQHVHEII
jgi:D-beta-D-heptose 7-phosphate kinase/D-beta-D-heptose 1-phosphate adenosyltransferase